MRSVQDRVRMNTSGSEDSSYRGRYEREKRSDRMSVEDRVEDSSIPSLVPK